MRSSIISTHVRIELHAAFFKRLGSRHIQKETKLPQGMTRSTKFYVKQTTILFGGQHKGTM